MLREDEGNVQIYGEDIGVDLQEFELDLVIDDLHTIVIVEVHLVFDVEKQEGDEDEEQDQGHVEGIEGDEGPDLEHDY